MTNEKKTEIADALLEDIKNELNMAWATEAMEKKIFGLIVSSIGVLVILLTVLLTTHIYWRSTSAYIFIIMFSLVAVGGALVLKELLRSK